MKKLIISGALLSAFVANPALAQTNIPKNVRTEIEANKAQIKNAQEKLRAIAEKSQENRGKATTTNDKSGFRQDIAKMRAAVATRVYDATIARLDKLVERIASRIEKVKAEGGVTAEAESFVATAKTNIADAKAHIAIMQSLDVSTSTASTTARANFEKMKTEAKAARELLTSAKQNLQKAINALARLNKGLKSGKNATSTPAATTTSAN